LPYSNLPNQSFWASCRRDGGFELKHLYSPKFSLSKGDRVATIGSCFAQHIGRYMRNSTLAYQDVEPPPVRMSDTIAKQFGYGLFSARYGNVYTVRQALQLVQDCQAETIRDCAIWTRGRQFYDALRPGIEPKGYVSKGEMLTHRRDHLRRVLRMLQNIDVLVFTLGLTEAWVDRETGTVFPTAPGVIAGTYDPDRHAFANFGLAEVSADMDALLDALNDLRPGLRVILTVSPVPLAATATGGHVLSATTYSKSVLRAVAGEAAGRSDTVAYFPSYEIITGAPFADRFWERNLRDVTAEGVDTVMSVFFDAHEGLLFDDAEPQPSERPEPMEGDTSLICEEALLNAFARE